MSLGKAMIHARKQKAIAKAVVMAAGHEPMQYTHAHILQIEDNHVQVANHVRGRPPLRISLAVNAIDLHAGLGISRVRNDRGVGRAFHAVLRAEDRGKLQPRRIVQHIDGALTARVHSCLIRH